MAKNITWLLTAFRYLVELKKLFTILFMFCIMAPSVSRWAAYVHCKMAEVNLNSDCGCDEILIKHPSPGNDHSAPSELVQHTFYEWQFEQPAPIQCCFLPASSGNPFASAYQGSPTKDFVQSIFHPPGC